MIFQHILNIELFLTHKKSKLDKPENLLKIQFTYGGGIWRGGGPLPTSCPNNKQPNFGCKECRSQKPKYIINCINFGWMLHCQLDFIVKQK
jgi:hypothetical protein